VTKGKTDTEKDKNIFAVLMASGFSLRFGSENKLLVPFRGKALARYTLDLVCAMGCFREIIFVTADERIAALAEGLSLTIVRNAAPEKGQREIVRLGLEAAGRAAAAACAYYIFFPCDQPLLDAASVRLILKARRPGCIVEPRYRGKPGSPSLFSAAFRDELLALNEGESPRVIKARHPEAVIGVELNDPLALADIDKPEDLARLKPVPKAFSAGE
jgi:molybdenum cofactor cytidylyltransferase